MARNTIGIPESDLVIPALRLASVSENGRISTSMLIAELTDLFQPDGKDAEIIEGRNDTHFSQKVRNLVSHRRNPRNLIGNGFAEHFDIPGQPRSGGIEITQRGRDLLKSIGV